VGNARGSGSLDLQLYRDTAGQVASGGDSVCIGQSNTASGNSSICVGIYNTNSGLRSFAAGVSNTITASPNTYGQFAIGESNVVAGQCSGAIGRNNITIAGYSGNLVLGERGEGKQYGAVIVGNGNTNAYGLSQLGMVPIYVQTTNATPASIGMHWYAETTAYDFMCHAKKAYKFRIDVVALSDVTDGYKTAAWEISGLITRDASNNTRIIGTPIITQIAADADAISGGWTVTIQANDTTDKLQVLATGEFNTIIRWTGSIFWAEVGHA
jgi:hypothetical protein